jgi:hypothetical protein
MLTTDQNILKHLRAKQIQFWTWPAGYSLQPLILRANLIHPRLNDELLCCSVLVHPGAGLFLISWAHGGILGVGSPHCSPHDLYKFI